MNYWIFGVTPQKVDGLVLSAQEIYQQRMQDKFWGLGQRTPNRKHLQAGDKVVFYVGRPYTVFAGTATLSSPSFALSAEQKAHYGHDLSFYQPEYGVLLDDIQQWSNPQLVTDLAPALTFIENEEFWPAYFQGGVRQIVEEDYQTIVNAHLGVSSKLQQAPADIADAARFALEKHLEEFIHQNWSNINWERPLELYRTEEQNGRQFPAGTWSIDFLAIDRDTNDLVVIELKRGHTSDAVVGQMLRYMNWVRENVAANKQQVRGIIVAQDVDEALRYAVKSLPDVEVKTYQVSFKLNSIDR